MKRSLVLAWALSATFATAAQAQSAVPPPRHVESGMLSNHVYSLPIPSHSNLETPGAASGRWSAPPGYEVVGSLGNQKHGFHGAIYKNVDTQKYTVVYRGTTYESTRDTSTNVDIVKQGGPDLERQLGDARKLTDHAISKYGKENVSVAGHSLGGGIAQVESARTGVRAETYNAPGMGEYIREKYPDARVDQISNNNRQGDAVSRVGTQPGYRREFEGTFPQSTYERALVTPSGAIAYGGGGSEAYLDHRMDPFAKRLAGGATPIDAPTLQPLNGRAATVDQWGDGGATARRKEFEGIARQNADDARAKAAVANYIAAPEPTGGATSQPLADVLTAALVAAGTPRPSPAAPPPGPLAAGVPLLGGGAPPPTTYSPPPVNNNPGGNTTTYTPPPVVKGTDIGKPAAKSCPKKAFKTKDGCHPGHSEKAHPGGCFCG